MDQDDEAKRLEELEDLIKLVIIEKEKGGRMDTSLRGSIKLGFGLAFGFWIFHVILLMFLLLLTLALNINIPLS